MESLPRCPICVGMAMIPLPASDMAFYRGHQIAASIASIMVEKERGLVPTTSSQPALVRVMIIFLGCVKALAETTKVSDSRSSDSLIEIEGILTRIFATEHRRLSLCLKLVSILALLLQ